MTPKVKFRDPEIYCSKVISDSCVQGEPVNFSRPGQPPAPAHLVTLSLGVGGWLGSLRTAARACAPYGPVAGACRGLPRGKDAMRLRHVKPRAPATRTTLLIYCCSLRTRALPRSATSTVDEPIPSTYSACIGWYTT
jgi:hypothetical protein